jgi:hypothetical protein
MEYILAISHAIITLQPVPVFRRALISPVSAGLCWAEEFRLNILLAGLQRIMDDRLPKRKMIHTRPRGNPTNEPQFSLDRKSFNFFRVIFGKFALF